MPLRRREPISDRDMAFLATLRRMCDVFRAQVPSGDLVTLGVCKRPQILRAGRSSNMGYHLPPGPMPMCVNLYLTVPVFCS